MLKRKAVSILRIAVCWSVVLWVARAGFDLLSGHFSVDTLLFLPKTIVGGFLQKGALWQFWYLGALLIVYALSPILYKVKRWLLPIWICLAIGGCGIQFLPYFLGAPVQGTCIQTFRLWTWLQYYILGGLMGTEAFICRVDKLAAKPARLTLCLLLVTLCVVVYQSFAGRLLLHDLRAEFFYDDPFTIIWVCVLFIWGLRIKLSVRMARTIQRFSPLLMGVYIVHPLWIRLCLQIISIDTTGLSIAFFLLIAFLSCLTSFVAKKTPLVKRLVEL